MFRPMLTLALYLIVQPVLALSSELPGAGAARQHTDLRKGSSLFSVAAEPGTFRASTPEDLDTRSSEHPRDERRSKSDVFGADLFRGAFIRKGATEFNPAYVIAAGDRIQVHFWEGYQFDGVLSVDPKGNILLPRIGPVKVTGIRNGELHAFVQRAVENKVKSRVSSYVGLVSAQPVQVFVGGFVARPGLYPGTATDSLLHYLDLAGGVDPERGSFHAIQVKRGDTVLASVSLYDFLLDGRLPMFRFSAGDIIFVGPRQNTIKVTGLVDNAKRFEFGDGYHTVASISWLARPKPEATHVRVVRNVGNTRNVEYYSLESGSRVILGNGDEIEFVADKKPGTIAVRVEGEQPGAREYVLPYGTRLGELLRNIRRSGNAERQNVQLYRNSVRAQQRQALAVSSNRLREALLKVGAGATKGSSLAKDNVAFLLEWVDQVSEREPKGQITVAESSKADDLVLEGGDVLRIRKHDGPVLVSGEVFFPSAIAYDPKVSLLDYIQRAGGFTSNANTEQVVVAHPDGSVEDSRSSENGFFGRTGPKLEIREGDQIVVLPAVRTGDIKLNEEISDLVYRIAITSR